MKQAFGLVRRPWGVFYLKHKITGIKPASRQATSTRRNASSRRTTNRRCQPHFNLSLARVYLNGADPKLATRTWQEVMENIVAKKTDETRRRWDVAIKDTNFDCIRNLPVCRNPPGTFRPGAGRWQGVHQCLFAAHSQSRPGHGMAPEIGHSAPAMAQAGVQDQAGDHGGRTRGHRPARTKPGAAGFLRNAVAYRRVTNRRGLPAGGGCGLEHAHHLLHAQETQVRVARASSRR